MIKKVVISLILIICSTDVLLAKESQAVQEARQRLENIDSNLSKNLAMMRGIVREVNEELPILIVNDSVILEQFTLDNDMILHADLKAKTIACVFLKSSPVTLHAKIVQDICLIDIVNESIKTDSFKYRAVCDGKELSKSVANDACGLSEEHDEEKHEETDAAEQHRIGRKYDNGTGVEEDNKKAIYWYTKAARRGYSDSQFNLGLLYYLGETGVKQDYVEAAYWYTQAAKQGDKDAQYYLGYIYNNGLGTTQHIARSMYWYDKSAKAGHTLAQYNFALTYDKLYNKGKGEDKHYNKAVYWYQKAANQGDKDAQARLKILNESW